MSITIDQHGAATVDTLAEALALGTANNIESVTIRDCREQMKLEKLLRCFKLAPVRS